MLHTSDPSFTAQVFVVDVAAATEKRRSGTDLNVIDGEILMGWEILRTEERSCGSRLLATRWLMCSSGAVAPILTCQSRANKSRKRLVVRKAREEERVQSGEEAGERGRRQVTKTRQNP